MAEPAADSLGTEETGREESTLVEQFVVGPLVAIRTSITLFTAVIGVLLFVLGLGLDGIGVLVESPTPAILGVLGISFVVFAVVAKAFFWAIGYS